MSRINYTAATPPGRWRWRDPISGKTYSTTAAQHLVAVVQDVMKANARPTLTVAEIEEIICEQNDYGKPYCLGRQGAPWGVLSIGSLTNFAKTVFNWVVGGGNLEPMDVVESRARICAECPRNESMPGCQDCPAETIAKEVEELMLSDARKTTDHDALKMCRQCGCRNALKIQLPANAFRDDKFSYPSWCWMNNL